MILQIMYTVKVKHETVHLWTCPKCKRQFERKGQMHSCRLYALEMHFEGKPAGKLLYEKFKRAVKKQVGAFKTESLECCIHFVSTFTFAAVKINKDRIRVDFALDRNIKRKRVKQCVQMSAQRYLLVIDIVSEDDIDNELMEWIQEAYDKKHDKHTLA